MNEHKLLTINEISKLFGISVRTLHYYDEIGLLTPAQTKNTGYGLPELVVICFFNMFLAELLNKKIALI